jgi:acyl dehydratase
VTASFRDVRVGDAIPGVTWSVSRDDLSAYADASGDRNPLHLDDEAARAVGFPGVIAHGMLTMGRLASAVLGWAGDGAWLTRLRAQFRAPVFAGETVVCGGTVTSIDEQARTVRLEVWATVERDGQTQWPIRRGEAEVRFP